MAARLRERRAALSSVHAPGAAGLVRTLREWRPRALQAGACHRCASRPPDPSRDGAGRSRARPGPPSRPRNSRQLGSRAGAPAEHRPDDRPDPRRLPLDRDAGRSRSLRRHPVHPLRPADDPRAHGELRPRPPRRSGRHPLGRDERRRPPADERNALRAAGSPGRPAGPEGPGARARRARRALGRDGRRRPLPVRGSGLPASRADRRQRRLPGSYALCRPRGSRLGRIHRGRRRAHGRRGRPDLHDPRGPPERRRHRPRSAPWRRRLGRHGRRRPRADRGRPRVDVRGSSPSDEPGISPPRRSRREPLDRDLGPRRLPGFGQGGGLQVGVDGRPHRRPHLEPLPGPRGERLDRHLDRGSAAPPARRPRQPREARGTGGRQRPRRHAGRLGSCLGHCRQRRPQPDHGGCDPGVRDERRAPIRPALRSPVRPGRTPLGRHLHRRPRGRPGRRLHPRPPAAPCVCLPRRPGARRGRGRVDLGRAPPRRRRPSSRGGRPALRRRGRPPVRPASLPPARARWRRMGGDDGRARAFRGGPLPRLHETRRTARRPRPVPSARRRGNALDRDGRRAGPVAGREDRQRRDEGRALRRAPEERSPG